MVKDEQLEMWTGLLKYTQGRAADSGYSECVQSRMGRGVRTGQQLVTFAGKNRSALNWWESVTSLTLLPPLKSSSLCPIALLLHTSVQRHEPVSASLVCLLFFLYFILECSCSYKDLQHHFVCHFK